MSTTFPDISIRQGFDLPDLYAEAETFIRDYECEELADEFADAEELYFRVGEVDLGEWVNRYYREQYRQFQTGERDAPLCECPNPRCGLKRGTLPYQLRQRDSTVRERDREPTAVLRQFLREHPQARVIDDALDTLESDRQAVADQLREIVREAKRIAIEEVDEDTPVITRHEPPTPHR